MLLQAAVVQLWCAERPQGQAHALVLVGILWSSERQGWQLRQQLQAARWIASLLPQPQHVGWLQHFSQPLWDCERVCLLRHPQLTLHPKQDVGQGPAVHLPVRTVVQLQQSCSSLLARMLQLVTMLLHASAVQKLRVLGWGRHVLRLLLAGVWCALAPAPAAACSCPCGRG